MNCSCKREQFGPILYSLHQCCFHRFTTWLAALVKPSTGYRNVNEEYVKKQQDR